MNGWEYKTYLANFSHYDAPPWEGYKAETLTDAQLAALGSEGWELVSVTRLTHQSRRNNTGGWPEEGTLGVQYIFKRQTLRKYQ